MIAAGGSPHAQASAHGEPVSAGHSVRPGCDFFYHRGQEIDVAEETFALTVQVR